MPAMQVLGPMLIMAITGVAAAQPPARAQAQPLSSTEAKTIWQMQESGTTAGLRGIDSVDGKVVWASGTGGTVLKTIDGGAHWLRCVVPDAATDGATLDFRGVQAWDANTAIVMASGKGKLSRLYKTKDGCRTWKLIFKNPDKDGFWDALYFGNFEKGKGPWNNGWLLGDPVKGMFTLFYTENVGKDWYRQSNKGLRVKQGSQGVFAASNSSFLSEGGPTFGSGGSGGAFVYSLTTTSICLDDCPPEDMNLDGKDDHGPPRGSHSERIRIPQESFRWPIAIRTGLIRKSSSRAAGAPISPTGNSSRWVAITPGPMRLLVQRRGPKIAADTGRLPPRRLTVIALPCSGANL
jgi:hypothetical protein